ncbi:Rho GTPase activation protein [Polychytrium aggregatum]|uniref:Rho GTPase activation protein n=1 Tax=Polychytrium aggregatum TaxID=110093 RepID=UPI0022FE2283|nr:Rho GTPase activation protein [Polychytrium aggregatum]KAI9209041.1 Rho GTPase activation protein [Polychytrium aggregatum]
MLSTPAGAPVPIEDVPVAPPRIESKRSAVRPLSEYGPLSNIVFATAPQYSQQASSPQLSQLSLSLESQPSLVPHIHVQAPDDSSAHLQGQIGSPTYIVAPQYGQTLPQQPLKSSPKPIYVPMPQHIQTSTPPAAHRGPPPPVSALSPPKDAPVAAPAKKKKIFGLNILSSRRRQGQQPNAGPQRSLTDEPIQMDDDPVPQSPTFEKSVDDLYSPGATGRLLQPGSPMRSLSVDSATTPASSKSSTLSRLQDMSRQGSLNPSEISRAVYMETLKSLDTDVSAQYTAGVLFAASLEDAAKRSGREQTGVCTVVVTCAEFIERYGMELEGIYRKSGAQSRIFMYEQSFESGENVTFNGEGPHTVAGVMKLFLRKIPGSLLGSNQLRDELTALITAGSSNPSDPRLVNLFRTTLIEALPSRAHVETVKYVFRHFRAVSQRSSVNLMTPNNLALSIFPLQAAVAEFIIQNCPLLFPEDK